MKIIKLIALAMALLFPTATTADTLTTGPRPLLSKPAGYDFVKKGNFCYCRVSDAEGCWVPTSYGIDDRCDCGPNDQDNTCRRRPCVGVFERCP